MKFQDPYMHSSKDVRGTKKCDNKLDESNMPPLHFSKLQNIYEIQHVRDLRYYLESKCRKPKW